MKVNLGLVEGWVWFGICQRVGKRDWDIWADGGGVLDVDIGAMERLKWKSQRLVGYDHDISAGGSGQVVLLLG